MLALPLQLPPTLSQVLTYCGEKLKGRYTIAKHFHDLMKQVGRAGGREGQWQGCVAEWRVTACIGWQILGDMESECRPRCSCRPLPGRTNAAPTSAVLVPPGLELPWQASALDDVVLMVEHLDHQLLAGEVTWLTPAWRAGLVLAVWEQHGLCRSC